MGEEGSPQLSREGTVRALALVLLLIGLGHSGVLWAGFVWDDVPLVVKNRWLGELDGIVPLLTRDLWDGAPVEAGVSGYYRPIFLADLWIDRWLMGLSSVWHHFRGLIWHLIVCFLAYQLALPRVGLVGAWVATLWFGLHPIQTEAVIWVAARNDLMAAAFGLGALLALESAELSGRRMVVAFGLALLATLSKESSALLVFFRLSLDIFDGRRLREVWVRYLPLLAAVFAVVGLRFGLGLGGAGWPEETGWALLARSAHRLVLLAAGMGVWPWPGSSAWASEYLDRIPTWRLSVGGIGLLTLVLLGWNQPRQRVVAFWLWVAVAICPSVLAIADKGLFGERYLYLAMFAPGWMLGIRVQGISPKAQRGLLLVLPLAIATIQVRGLDWRDDVSLWTAAVRASPSPYSQTSLGHALLLEEKPREAYEQFYMALADPQPWPDACAPLLVSAQSGLGPEALVELAEWATNRGCADGRFVGLRAVFLAQTGRFEEAERLLSGAPTDPKGRADVVRAALWGRAGDWQRVRELSDQWGGSPTLEEQARGLLAAGEAWRGRPR